MEKNEVPTVSDTAVSDTPAESPQVQKKSNFSKLAIVFGAILLIIVVSVLSFFLIGSQNKEPQPSPVANMASPKPLTLTLDSPKDEELSVNDEILVKGKTLPNTTVVMFNEADEATVDSDANGNFETTIKLADGINSLTVTAFAEDGQEKSLTVDVVRNAES